MYICLCVCVYVYIYVCVYACIKDMYGYMCVCVSITSQTPPLGVDEDGVFLWSTLK